MNVALRISFCTISLAALALAPGCRKKPSAVSESGPPADAPAQAIAPVSTAPFKEKAATSEESATAPAVSAELAAGDAAYAQWFEQYKLDLGDPNMLDEDSDGDGYSNREEFLANTDPRDPNSHPKGHAGVHQTIQMKSYSEVNLPFVLKSVEGESAQIERLDEGADKVETVKAGQPLRNSTYKLERVIERHGVDKEGNQVDASRIMLTQPGSKEKTVLVKDLRTRSSETHAMLVSADGKTSLNVRAGETFSWPGETGISYKVIDLGSSQVVLQEVETGKMWTVPKR